MQCISDPFELALLLDYLSQQITTSANYHLTKSLVQWNLSIEKLHKSKLTIKQTSNVKRVGLWADLVLFGVKPLICISFDVFYVDIITWRCLSLTQEFVEFRTLNAFLRYPNDFPRNLFFPFLKKHLACVLVQFCNLIKTRSQLCFVSVF